jgi:DNA-binding cell septation regulator SpoVG
MTKRKNVTPAVQETVVAPAINVTVTRIFKVTGTGDSYTLAYADVNIAGLVGSKGWRVVRHDKGPYVSAPREKGKDGRWYEQVYGLTSDVRKAINTAIMTAYNAKTVAPAVVTV